MFEEIRKGAPPPRARDRGLTVRHLAQFFDTTIVDGFDDGPNVRVVQSSILLHVLTGGLRVSSQSTATYSIDSLTMKSNTVTLPLPPLVPPPGHGFRLRRRRRINVCAHFTATGRTSPPARSSTGQTSGILPRLRTGVSVGELHAICCTSQF